MFKNLKKTQGKISSKFIYIQNRFIIKIYLGTVSNEVAINLHSLRMVVIFSTFQRVKCIKFSRNKNYVVKRIEGKESKKKILKYMMPTSHLEFQVSPCDTSTELEDPTFSLAQHQFLAIPDIWRTNKQIETASTSQFSNQN